MIAGIKVNGKFQKITYKIKRCICAPHRLLTKFNPRGLGFVFFCNSTEPIDCTNADLTADNNKKKYEKYKPKNYTPTKHEYIE